MGEGHRGRGAGLRRDWSTAGFRVDVDERDETIGRRIRDAELEKVPYVVVWGDRESDDAIAVRDRGGGPVDAESLGELLDVWRRRHNARVRPS